MNNEERLERLLRCRHTGTSIVTLEEDYALGLVRDGAMKLRRPLYMWSLSGGVQDALIGGSPPIPDTTDPTAGLVHLAGIANEPICVTLDLAGHLKQERTLRVWRNLINQFRTTGSQLVMIDHETIKSDVVRAETTSFEIALPTEQDIESLVRETLRQAHRDHPILIDITRGGWRTVIRNLHGLTRRQIERIIIDCVADDRKFDEEDINHVLASKRRTLGGGGLLEYIETPVDAGEIGGLRRLKDWLKQRHGALTDKAAKFGLAAPRGVLMLGVQGAGKSLCAKAIATSWQRPLLRMDVGALYDRYVGESERRLRDALAQAEAMAPIILWIDEIEKAFASAASRSTDGGLSKRMFGTLLTWMQEHAEPVFLVATANDIEALPPELLRKGRFDEIFFVDLPREDTRAQIFAIHLKKRKRDPADFDLEALARESEGFSGAEIEQAVLSSLHDAFAQGTELSTEHVLRAIKNSPPLSVTMAEKIAELRAWAVGRCVPAD
ncbi:MAG: AAA family ATPase [Planctomycetes bacterium]|nr:AAA family ATPase [Planctomycetota bacterium]